MTNPETPAPMTDVPPPKGRLPEFLPVEGNEGLMATYFTVKCAHAAQPGKHNTSLLSLLEELARRRAMLAAAPPAPRLTTDDYLAQWEGLTECEEVLVSKAYADGLAAREPRQ